MAGATLRCPDGAYLYGDAEELMVPDCLVEQIARLEAMAEDNSPLAHAFRGCMCYWKKKDAEGARRLIENSMASGCSDVEKCFPRALALLGQLCDTGQGGPMNRKRSLELYRIAANEGVPEAQLNLGHMYYTGVDGVLDCNDTEAIHWLERGVSESLRDSDNPMLDSYMNLERQSFMISHGRKRVCQLRGMLTLSKIYFEGNEVEELRPNPILALNWLTNAAINGCSQAQFWLGAIVIAGLGYFNDVRKGRIWIRKASCGDPKFTDAVQIEHSFQEGKLPTAIQAVVSAYEREGIPFVPQVESTLIASVKEEILKSNLGISLELDSGRINMRAPIMLSADFLKNFQDSPTAQRIFRAFSSAKEGKRLLLSNPFDESKCKEMLQYFSEAYLLDVDVFQSISVDPIANKLEAACKATFFEDPTCEDALIARLPLYGSHPSHLEQGIAILSAATQVMESRNYTEARVRMKLSRVYLTLGSLQYWKKYYHSSLKNFEKSMELSSDDFTALEGAAECCRELKRLSDSKQRHLKFLSEAPKCHKHYPDAYYRIAEISFQMLDVPGFCYHFEKGIESEGNRLPFLPEVDLLVKKKLFGFYIVTRTDHLPFCSYCLQLETAELPLKRCRRCWSVYYCNRTCQEAHWKVHKNSCQQALECVARERENVHLANRELSDITSRFDLPADILHIPADADQLLDDARGLKESIRSDRLQGFQSHVTSVANCSTPQIVLPAIDEPVPSRDQKHGGCDSFSHSKTSKAVYETRRGAAGSVFAAHVSADAPEEVLLALVKEAAEISKLSIGAVASESTKVDVGASGKVALRIDKEPTGFPLSHVNPNWFPTRLQSFTGRTHVLKDLHKLLSGHSSSHVGKKINVVALCGLGGTGKSSIAAEYCWLQESHYISGVYWLSADFVDETLREVAALILEKTHDDLCQSSTKSVVYAVMAKISRLPSPWLIVIDNVDSIDQLSDGPIEYLLFGNWKQSSATCGSILVTTRCRPDTAVNELQLPSADNAVHLDVFSEEEAIAFILKSIQSVESSRDAAAGLSKLLGYLPLALEQATSGIRSMKCKLADYVKEYKKMSTRLMRKYRARKLNVNTADQRMTVLTTWELNFREIMRDRDCGTVAGLFLNLAAYLGADMIPVELINNGLRQEPSVAVNVESPLYVRMMVDLLTQLSLFREDLPGLLRVHRLVQEVKRNEMRHNVDQMVNVLEAGVRTLHRSLQRHPPPDTTIVLARDEAGSHVTWGMIARHCLAFQKHVLHERRQLGLRYLSFLKLEFANILNTSAIYASAIGRQGQSRQIESSKFRLLNCLDGDQDSTAWLPLTTVKIPLGTKVQAAVNCAIGKAADSSPVMATSNRQDVQKASAAVAENSDANRPSDLCDLVKEDSFLDSYRIAKATMHSYKFQKAFESALHCISLKPDRHEGYSLLAKLFCHLKCSFLNFSRSAATVAMFLDSPCSKEEWFKDAYPGLQCVEVTSRTELQQVLERQNLYANHVVILKGKEFVIDAVNIEENMSFVALGQTRMSVFDRFVVQKKSSFIRVNLTVHRNPVVIQPTAAVDLVLCEITTKEVGYPGIYLLGSAYLESCVISECGGGGLMVKGKESSAVVMSSTFVRNGAAALEACHQGRLLAMHNKLFENRQGCYLSPFPGHCLIKHNSIFLNTLEGLLYLNVCGEDMTSELGATMLVSMLQDAAVSTVHIDFDSNLVRENGSFGISVQQPISVGSMGIMRISNNLVTSNVLWGIFVDTPLGKDRVVVIEKNQIRRNRCGGIFVGEFNSTRCSIKHNVVEKNHTPFGSFKPIPCKELTKCNTVRPTDRFREEIDGPGSWIDPFCCRCHKEVKLLKDEKSGHFCQSCYSVRYCSEDCLIRHGKKHSILCKFIRSKYSTVVELSSPVYPPLNTVGRFTASQISGETTRFVSSERSRFVVKVRSVELDPRPSQSLILTDSNGDCLAKFECADLFPVIIECGNIVPGTCTSKEISCWAIAENPGRSLRLFYDELAPLKRNK